MGRKLRDSYFSLQGRELFSSQNDSTAYKQTTKLIEVVCPSLICQLWKHTNKHIREFSYVLICLTNEHLGTMLDIFRCWWLTERGAWALEEINLPKGPKEDTSGAQCQDQRLWVHWNTWHSLWTSGNSFTLWQWLSTDTGCQERLRSFHLSK